MKLPNEDGLVIFNRGDFVAVASTEEQCLRLLIREIKKRGNIITLWLHDGRAKHGTEVEDYYIIDQNYKSQFDATNVNETSVQYMDNISEKVLENWVNMFPTKSYGNIIAIKNDRYALYCINRLAMEVINDPDLYVLNMTRQMGDLEDSSISKNKIVNYAD